MNESPILYDFADGVATVTLNRPDRLNSFTEEMHHALRAAIDRAEAEKARALLLTGAGRGFCAGQDLSNRLAAPGAEKPDLGRTIGEYYNPLVRRLRALHMPVICAVNGVAAGAGANVALSCDIVLAARSASFLQAFARIGLIPDSGGTYWLPHLVGTARAMGLALLADKLSAEDAERWGLIWRAVDDDKLMSEARAIAAQLAAGPTMALVAIKRAIHAAEKNTLDEQLDHERDVQRALGASEDYAEGVRAFMEKRKAQFKGR